MNLDDRIQIGRFVEIALIAALYSRKCWIKKEAQMRFPLDHKANISHLIGQFMDAIAAKVSQCLIVGVEQVGTRRNLDDNYATWLENPVYLRERADIVDYVFENIEHHDRIARIGI